MRKNMDTFINFGELLKIFKKFNQIIPMNYAID